jgi:N-acetylglucosamine kinase-like BadF-type ATPase
LRRVCGAVEDALALGCGGEFGGRGLACGSVGLMREGGVGEFGGEGFIVGDQRRGRVVGVGALERCVEDADDVVDAAHAAAVAELLGW